MVCRHCGKEIIGTILNEQLDYIHYPSMLYGCFIEGVEGFERVYAEPVPDNELFNSLIDLYYDL